MSASMVAANAIKFVDLGLNPIAISFGPLAIRWYSLAYIAGILIGWGYLRLLLRQSNPPMTTDQADDLVTWATIGVIVGGRLGYVFFYEPAMLLNPVDIFRLWDGGMSFHGGALGVSLAMIVFARARGLQWLRVHDYVACVVPIGLFFGRVANFVNGELWGKPSTLPWAIVFPGSHDGIARHPSQLYEAGFEGMLLFALLTWLFWRTSLRHSPGKLVGAFLAGYGVARFTAEFFREPDVQLVHFAAVTGLHMGQWLTLPMIAVGLYLLRRSNDQRPSSNNSAQ